MGLFGMSSEKFVRPRYEVKKVIPFLNMTRPPTITTPDGQKGILVSIELNENGKYNWLLDTGHIIYNVDEENVKVVTGFMSLFTGDAVVAMNKTASGAIIPWDTLANGEANTEIIKMQRDHYRALAITAKDELTSATGGNKMLEKMEELAEGVGRMQSKAHGKMVFGRQEIAEHMSPEMEQLIGGGMGGGGDE
jgi:hypothetical protein